MACTAQLDEKNVATTNESSLIEEDYSMEGHLRLAQALGLTFEFDCSVAGRRKRKRSASRRTGGEAYAVQAATRLYMRI